MYSTKTNHIKNNVLLKDKKKPTKVLLPKIDEFAFPMNTKTNNKKTIKIRNQDTIRKKERKDA